MRSSGTGDEPGLQFLDVTYQDLPPKVLLYELGTTESIFRVTLANLTRWAYEEEVRAFISADQGAVRYRREALRGLIFSYKSPKGMWSLCLGGLAQGLPWRCGEQSPRPTAS
jgi:hypothetical protein